MHKSLASFGGLLLFASALGAVPCAPSTTSLCLSDGRFEVSVGWTDFANRTGVGQAVPLTPDTGYFWFFSDSNIELIVKVLDGRGINGKFWVFFGALSNVEYTLTVRDSVTGAVKNYQNPSGQFASVGDTLAFEGAAVAAASREFVVASGMPAPPAAIADVRRWIASPKAAPAFTPCEDRRFGFDLGNCRFHIEVDWDDGHGNTGVGQPVQLSSDTGYFWFFSAANVELVIKVLDARSANGNFWVFFGALSNVQYTITVVDTFTGAYRKYSNPSGTFASVGDTGAFSGGHSVVPVSDPAHAASANLDATGGSVSTTGADGTVFTLELPPDALASPRKVTLTPIASLGGLPFSGGLVAGVEIEPAGLDLLVPASLTILPATLPGLERALPFSYARAGEDFILYPGSVGNSSLLLPLARLGGYGLAAGSMDDAEAQAQRAATDPLNPYMQRYALEVLRRNAGLITQAELEDRGARIFQDAYNEQIAPLLSPAGGAAARGTRLKVYRTCWLGEMQEFLDLLFRLIRQRQMFNLPDLEGSAQTGTEIAIAKISACAQESFRLCVQNHDPGEVLFLINVARQLAELGLEDPALTSLMEGSLVERCLRFELEFESEFEYQASPGPVYLLQEQAKYHAGVPLRFLYGGNDILPNRPTFEGGCTLENEAAVLGFTAPPDAHCVATPAVSGTGRFEAKAAQINLSILSNELWAIYDPGEPSFDGSVKCSGQDLPVPIIPFRFAYDIFHADEVSSYGFVVNGWRQLRYLGGSPGDWAVKEYQGSFTGFAGPGTTLFEDTRFFLRHTPDAPMPACP